MPDQRLKGQEVSVRIVQGGVVAGSIDSIGSMNDNVALELKEDGFLGEAVNRFDEILNGFGGDFEFQVHRGDWNNLVQAITDRATRRTPDVQFNVIRVDLFPNGDSVTYTYTDAKFGPIPTSVASRGDFVKPKLEFRCSERPHKLEAVG
jgi:hypothetical protein